MNWRDWISEGYAARSGSRPGFRAGASREQVEQVEAALGVRLPVTLRELLLESDGVGESQLINNDWVPLWDSLWCCEEMIRENRAIRTEPDAPSPPPGGEHAALFIAWVGADGIPFAIFVNVDAPDDDSAVHAWYPIERVWRRISPTLKAHLHGWSV